MTSTILATFDNVHSARTAVDDLKTAGINSNDIGLVVQNSDGDLDGAEGAGFGATAGSMIGLAAGLVAIVIPGVGPVIAAGPLVAVLGAVTGAGIGAAAGAVTGGVVASLVNLGIPEDEAHYYAESLRRGAALVSVHNVGSADSERVKHILHRYSPIDMNERVNQWRSGGWTGFDPSAGAYTENPSIRGYDESLSDDPNFRETDDLERIRMTPHI